MKSLLALLLLAAGSAASQDAVAPRTSFELQVDACRYFGNDTLNYIELYYGVRENALSYAPEQGSLRGGIMMRYEVRRDSVLVSRKEWVVPHVLDDTLRLAKNQVMTGMQTFALPAGDYVVSVAARDLRTPSVHDSAALSVPIRRFPADRETFSDIEFCTQIVPSSNRQSLFYKNTLEVYPNPGKLYGAGLPILYYYVEAYNLAAGGQTDSVTIASTVLDGGGRELLSQRRKKPRTLNASVEIGTMNLSSLRSGSYMLRLAALGANDSALATSTKRFFVYKPGMVADTGAPAAVMLDIADYVTMPEEALDQEFAEAKYVASEPEHDQYEKLTDAPAKRKFLNDFWGRRGDGPAAGGSAYRDEYLKRVAFARQQFGTGVVAGWQTDRGRVYIMYGAPDDIQRFPSEAETVPYEIWEYRNLQGGVQFVFVDRNGQSEFRLVHSTLRGELQFPDWYEVYAHKSAH